MNFRYLKKINGELKISLEDEGLTFDQATEIACLSHKNQIPLNIWEHFEDLYLIEKRKDPKRKLNIKDFFVMVFKNGVESWIK